MKLLSLISAGIVATAVLAAAPASADRHGGGHGWKNKRVCKTVRDHGHKRQVCRNVRVRW
jgi:hypothetical protein